MRVPRTVRHHATRELRTFRTGLPDRGRGRGACTPELRHRALGRSRPRASYLVGSPINTSSGRPLDAAPGESPTHPCGCLRAGALRDLLARDWASRILPLPLIAPLRFPWRANRRDSSARLAIGFSAKCIPASYLLQPNFDVLYARIWVR